MVFERWVLFESEFIIDNAINKSINALIISYINTELKEQKYFYLEFKKNKQNSIKNWKIQISTFWLILFLSKINNYHIYFVVLDWLIVQTTKIFFFLTNVSTVSYFQILTVIDSVSILKN